MPTSLTLLPFGSTHTFSHAVLGPVEPTQELEETLLSLQVAHGRDVPLEFNTYLCSDEAGYHYGNTHEDAYGNPLKHVSAETLMGLAPQGLTYEFIPPMIAESWNAQAAWSYVWCLPDGWRVALYWG